MIAEPFRPVPGWPGYEVSPTGQVRSRKRGAVRLLSLRQMQSGYLSFPAYAQGKRKWRPVHIAVAEAFLGERPEGMQVRHLDGNPLNNHVENLAWGTPSENIQDQVRHGTHHYASLTHCRQGHPFDEANTYRNGTRRVCRTCSNAFSRRYKQQRRAAARAAA